MPVDTLKAKSPIDAAADALRSVALEAAEGEFLGSEDDLIARIGAARVTMRQAARLLEREGLLRTRRGINGGYFAARPNSEMVESVVCTYLDTLGLDGRHTGAVTTALWAQVLREAASAPPEARAEVVERLRRLVEEIDPYAAISVLGRAEIEIRTQMFELIDGAYIELMFRINAAFSRAQSKDTEDHTEVGFRHVFVAQWKNAKLMELGAIAAGDPTLAMMAALHERSVWVGRANQGTPTAAG